MLVVSEFLVTVLFSPKHLLHTSTADSLECLTSLRFIFLPFFNPFSFCLTNAFPFLSDMPIVVQMARGPLDVSYVSFMLLLLLKRALN